MFKLVMPIASAQFAEVKPDDVGELYRGHVSEGLGRSSMDADCRIHVCYAVSLFDWKLNRGLLVFIQGIFSTSDRTVAQQLFFQSSQSS
jgi:hypothetical protein